jgi:hypothetical protein
LDSAPFFLEFEKIMYRFYWCIHSCFYNSNKTRNEEDVAFKSKGIISMKIIQPRHFMIFENIIYTLQANNPMPKNAQYLPCLQNVQSSKLLFFFYYHSHGLCGPNLTRMKGVI